MSCRAWRLCRTLPPLGRPLWGNRWTVSRRTQNHRPATTWHTHARMKPLYIGTLLGDPLTSIWTLWCFLSRMFILFLNNSFKAYLITNKHAGFSLSLWIYEGWLDMYMAASGFLSLSIHLQVDFMHHRWHQAKTWDWGDKDDTFFLLLLKNNQKKNSHWFYSLD